MMTPATIDRVTTWAVVPMLAGLACWFAGLAISAIMLVGLGAMGGSFDEWRFERGLWMLGVSFLGLFGAMYLTFTFFSVADMFAGRAPVGLLAFDVFVSTSALSFMVRFLWAVTYWNCRVSSDA